MRTARTNLCLLLAVTLFVACGGKKSEPAPDGGDDGQPDAGRDAGGDPGRDSGDPELDAGDSFDAGEPTGDVWFVPNIASDLPPLFDDPDSWANARAKIDVFGLYHPEALAQTAEECGNMCGENLYPNLVSWGVFSRLEELGLPLALEVPALKNWDCTGDVAAAAVIAAVGNVVANGGRVTHLSMDEPYIGSTADGTCGLDAAEAAARTVAYTQGVAAALPGVQIGEIEPYPYFSEPELEAWLASLLDQGAPLTFFHLDVDMNHVRNIHADVTSDLRALQAYVNGRGLRFGVIYTTNEFGAPADPADVERWYHDQVMDWIDTVRGAIGVPEDSIFQSWFLGPGGVKNLPVNVPEDDPAIYSHTRLVNDGWDLLVHGR